MSGHSHAKTVRRTKDANAAKRGQIFSKVSRMVSVAAKEGNDPATNAKLRQALDEAKRANMPKENVERAIKRGTEEEGGEQLEEVLYEAIGPSGMNLILEGITDNKNRTLSEVRQVLQKHNCKLAQEGSVKWAFEQKGVIILRITNQTRITNKEELELTAIEAGADNLIWYQENGEDFLEVQTRPEDLEGTKKNLENKGLKIDSAKLGWAAKEEIEVSAQDKAKCEKLFEDLDDNEAVQEIYSNLKV